VIQDAFRVSRCERVVSWRRRRALPARRGRWQGPGNLRRRGRDLPGPIRWTCHWRWAPSLDRWCRIIGPEYPGRRDHSATARSTLPAWRVPPARRIAAQGRRRQDPQDRAAPIAPGRTL